MNKKEMLNELFYKMGKCSQCVNMRNKNGRDCSLINIFQDDTFYKQVPSIWTDWYNRVDSQIMIVGQDWGPYKDMVRFQQKYIKNPIKDNWKKIIEEEKSLTKKKLIKYLEKTAKDQKMQIEESFLNSMYITNAIMCARKADTYRGNNIKLKDSTTNCQRFLEEQINIVKPKVIATLGYYPLYALANIYNFTIEPTLKKTIEKHKEIVIKDYVIIPLYHPVAQVKEITQLEQYNRIWNHIDEKRKRV